MKKVSVITVNYNHSEVTKECLVSIQNSTYDELTIYVIDNGSELNDYKNLLELESSNTIICRIEKNKGYVGGINFGLEEASKKSPDYFLIMNNDTIIDKNAIKELVKTAEKYDDNCIVSGKVYNMDEPDTLQYIGQWCRNFNNFDFPPYIKNMREKDEGQYDHEMEMDMLDDIFWLLPLKVFKTVGFYSEYFFLYGEQIDYALRANKKGVRLIYTPYAKLWHKGSLTTAEGDMFSPKIIFWRNKSYLILAFLHLKLSNFLHFYLKFFISTIITRCAKIIHKDRKKRIIYKAQLLAFINFTKWLFNRKKDEGYNPF